MYCLSRVLVLILKFGVTGLIDCRYRTLISGKK